MNSVFVFLYVILLSFMTFPLAPWIWERWTAHESYYSHGPLLVLLGLYLIFAHFNSSRPNLLFRLSKCPVGLLSAGAFLYVSGALFRVFFISAIGLLLVFAGLIGYLAGANHFSKIKWPLFFMFLGIPLPMVLTEQLAMFLKSISIRLSSMALNLMGIKARVAGNVLLMPYSKLEVGAPCSGLRSMLSVFSLSLFFVYIRKPKPLVAGALILSAPIVALLGNVFRITSLGFVADVYGTKYAMGFFHDFMGYVAFVFDLLILFALEWVFTQVYGVFFDEKGRVDAQ